MKKELTRQKKYFFRKITKKTTFLDHYIKNVFINLKYLAAMINQGIDQRDEQS